MKQEYIKRILVWGLTLGALLAAFIAFGLWLRKEVPVPMWSGIDTEIYSFDYLRHAELMSDYHFIGYGRFRHPLFSWLIMPITLFGQSSLEKFGESGFWVYLCTMFSLIVLGAVVLMRRLLEKGVGLGKVEAFSVTALFVSFAQVWLHAGIPETYAVSLLIALVFLNFLTLKITDPKVELWGWGVMAGLMGGVTLTQGIKTALAFIVAKKPKLKQLLIVAAGIAAIITAVVVFFYLRMKLRTYMNPSARGFDGAYHELFAPLTGWAMHPKEWLHRAYVFFSEPIIVRGEPFEQRTIEGGYSLIVQPALLFVTYFIALIGAFRGRKEQLVRILGAMFLVDVAIHFVLGWGLEEAQLYGAHWFFSVPVLIGYAIKGAEGKFRGILIAIIAILALGIFASNIYGFFL